MKNLLHNIQIWAVLALLMAGIQSCSNETPEADYAEVSFTATLPGGALSRSFGDAERVNTLMVGVYDAQYKELYRKSFPISSTRVEICLALAQKQTYHFVFWAYNGDSGFYDISNLTAIRMTVPEGNLTFSQVEASDAFFATKKQVTVVGDSKFHMELVRPLAQINVGTLGKAMPASFKVKSMPDTFRPFENSISTSTTNSSLTWNFAGNTDKETFTVEDKEYSYLTMVYLFAPTTKTEMAAELTLTDEATGESETVEFPKIEIEANCRSNIVGYFTVGNEY